MDMRLLAAPVAAFAILALAISLPAPLAAVAEMQFEKYQLVILHSVPGAKNLSKDEHAALMQQHLGHFRKMAAEGKLAVAGPFADQDDKTAEGLCLYRVGSVSEARALAESDPAVKSGQLRVEVMTWFTEKGALEFPAAEKLRKKETPGAK
jgi:uncharacterized protein YciI